NAQRSATQGDPFRGKQVSRRELNPYRVHQQDDPNFSQQLQFVNVGKPWPRCEWPDEYAPSHIAQNERLAQQPRADSSHHRGPEHIREVAVQYVALTHSKILSASRLLSPVFTPAIIYNLTFLTSSGASLNDSLSANPWPCAQNHARCHSV